MLPRRARMGLTAFSFFSMIAVSVAQADDVREVKDFRIHQHYRSVRALGMGDAFVAAADDYNTMFYNPAGLARITEPQVNLSLGAAADSKFMKFYNDVNSASGSQDSTKLGTLLAENYGNYYAARASLLQAVWVRPGWGLAVLPIDLSLDFSIHQLAAASLNLISYQDTTIAWGKGWKTNWFKGHDTSLGFTTKAIYRAYYNRAFFAPDLAQKGSKLLRAQDADEGLTVDADLGLLWTPKLSKTSWWRFTKPTVGLVARNIFDYGFRTNFHWIDPNSGTPVKLGRRFDLGTKFDLPDWWIWKVRAAADMRDMGHDNFTVKKGFHAGAELLWKVKSWWQGGWRVGVNQGYPTFGFTGTFGFFTLDLVTYADEVGPSDQPKAVRTYALKASLDW